MYGLRVSSCVCLRAWVRMRVSAGTALCMQVPVCGSHPVNSAGGFWRHDACSILQPSCKCLGMSVMVSWNVSEGQDARAVFIMGTISVTRRDSGSSRGVCGVALTPTIEMSVCRQQLQALSHCLCATISLSRSNPHVCLTSLQSPGHYGDHCVLGMWTTCRVLRLIDGHICGWLPRPLCMQCRERACCVQVCAWRTTFWARLATTALRCALHCNC